jgi:hypothetical protein
VTADTTGRASANRALGPVWAACLAWLVVALVNQVLIGVAAPPTATLGEALVYRGYDAGLFCVLAVVAAVGAGIGAALSFVGCDRRWCSSRRSSSCRRFRRKIWPASSRALL